VIATQAAKSISSSSIENISSTQINIQILYLPQSKFKSNPTLTKETKLWEYRAPQETLNCKLPIHTIPKLLQPPNPYHPQSTANSQSIPSPIYYNLPIHTLLNRLPIFNPYYPQSTASSQSIPSPIDCQFPIHTIPNRLQALNPYHPQSTANSQFIPSPIDCKLPIHTIPDRLPIPNPYYPHSTASSQSIPSPIDCKLPIHTFVVQCSPPVNNYLSLPPQCLHSFLQEPNCFVVASLSMHTQH